MIGRNDRRATSDRAWRFIATYGLDLVFAHEALDTMKTTVGTLESEVAKSKGYIARAEGASQAQASVGGEGSPLAALEG